MHPITIMEILVSIVFVIVIFAIAILLPRKFRKFSLISASSLTVLVLLFFTIRPFWIDYQVSKKTEQLNHFLEEKYPNQEWEISSRVGRQYSPYFLEVNFENEDDYTYTYSVVNEQKICQSTWAPPVVPSAENNRDFSRSHLLPHPGIIST